MNPKTNLCLYVNKKCDKCRKLYMVHKKISEKQLKCLNIIRPVPSLDTPYSCDCCKKNIFTTKTIQLDHCHETGQFRGWLCKECNISMGNLGDNVIGLTRAIAYMNKTEKHTIDNILNMLISHTHMSAPDEV